MFIFRPALIQDIDSLISFSHSFGPGFAGIFKQSRDKIGALVEHSIQTFCRLALAPLPEDFYLFVLLDDDKQIVGLYKIAAVVNAGAPFYTYKRSFKTIRGKKHELLTLSTDCSHTTHPGAQFLHPKMRGTRDGRIIMNAQFLFFSQFRCRFCDCISTECRGVYDQGQSVFWKYFLKYFLGNWDYLHYLEELNHCGEEAIVQKLPHGPFLVSSLPEEAQKCLGMFHEEVRFNVKLTKREGFDCNQHYAYSTGAPIGMVRLNNLKSVQSVKTIQIDKIVEKQDTLSYLISNRKRGIDFAVVRGNLNLHGDSASITHEAATKLGVKVGSTISFLR